MRTEPTTTVLGFDDLKTHRVFTPYYRPWTAVPLRALEAPSTLGDPGVASEPLPVAPDGRSPQAAPGGESAGRARFEWWLTEGLAAYGRARGGDDLAAGHTSRLSPYLHFGCVSPLEYVTRSRAAPGGEPWIREVCWRDFYAQLLYAFPRTSRADLYERAYPRGDAGHAFDAWCAGHTGYPLVDAGMRQLAAEGWMHNRARLVVASFLVKDLGVDWRHGADYFERMLIDGDVASNRGNWQWVAGSGVDHAQGGRMFNPTHKRSDVIRGATTSAATCRSLRASTGSRSTSRGSSEVSMGTRSDRRPRGRRLPSPARRATQPVLDPGCQRCAPSPIRRTWFTRSGEASACTRCR